MIITGPGVPSSSKKASPSRSSRPPFLRHPSSQHDQVRERVSRVSLIKRRQREMNCPQVPWPHRGLLLGCHAARSLKKRDPPAAAGRETNTPTGHAKPRVDCVIVLLITYCTEYKGGVSVGMSRIERQRDPPTLPGGSSHPYPRDISPPSPHRLITLGFYITSVLINRSTTSASTSVWVSMLPNTHFKKNKES